MKVTQNWEDEDFLQQLWFSGCPLSEKSGLQSPSSGAISTKTQIQSQFVSFTVFKGASFYRWETYWAWVEDCVASVALPWNVLCSDPSTTCQSLIKVPYLSLAKVQKGKEFSQSHLGVWHVTCSSKSLKTLHQCFVDCTMCKNQAPITLTYCNDC